MAMKTLLVPVHKDGWADAVLDTACAFAQRYGCYLEGVALDITRSEYITSDVYGAAWVPVPRERTETEARESRELFQKAMAARSIPEVAVPTAGLSQAWCDSDLTAIGGVSGYARAFDATVFGRCPPSEFAGHRFVLESTLFESGRPILIAPRTPPRSIGETVVIAWNCSTESARTVAFSMPVIEAAKRVIVLTVETGTVQGPTGADLARRLKANGIDAAERTVPAHARSTGATILAEAQSLGCDLLIKGAYTQSRLRQMIFGGATSHILTHAEIPVLMAN